MATPETFITLPGYGLGEANGVIVNVPSGNQSGEIVVGEHQLIQVCNQNTQAIAVRFGPPGTNTATGADWIIFAGTSETFDTGPNISMAVTGPISTAVSYYIFTRS